MSEQTAEPFNTDTSTEVKQDDPTTTVDADPVTGIQNTSAFAVDSTNVGHPADGDTHDITGNRDFEKSSAKVGLTSSIDEFVHIGREQFMQIFEEALGDVVVFQVECDINGLLALADVRAPHNESLNATLPADSQVSDKIELKKVGKFEWLLKHAVAQEKGAIHVDYQKAWAELGPSSNKNAGKKLYQQVRSFLGDFFDHDKELNAIVAQTNSSDPRALVLLDDDKIKQELANLKNDGSNPSGTMMPAGEDGLTYVSATDPTPADRKCLATNLLSVRQVAQVLEAFAAMGVGSKDSRVKRINTADDGETPVYIYKYMLHPGDSIIGECKIYDADALDSGKQYSQIVKVQLTQSQSGTVGYNAETLIDNAPGLTDPSDGGDITEPASVPANPTPGSTDFNGPAQDQDQSSN